MASVKKLGPKTIDVSHLSLASVHQNQELLRQVSRYVGVGSSQNHMSAWIGIETGSCRILKMHMPNKARPAEIGNWPEIVRIATASSRKSPGCLWQALCWACRKRRQRMSSRPRSWWSPSWITPGSCCPSFSPPSPIRSWEDSKGFAREDALPEHWQLVGLCLEYNLRHLKKLHRLYRERMTAGPAVHAALKGINLMADLVLSKYMKRMKRGEPPN